MANFGQTNMNFNINNNMYMFQMFQLFQQWLMSMNMNPNMMNLNQNNMCQNNMFQQFLNANNINNFNPQNTNFNPQNMNFNPQNMNFNPQNMNVNPQNINVIPQDINRVNADQNEPKGVIERGDKFIQFTDNLGKTNNNIMANIHLIASSGLKVLLNVPKDITMKELFRLYVKKLGISPKHLGKDIIFIYNAEAIDINEQKKFSQLVKGSTTMTITVIDQNNVIGANSI